MGFKQKNLKTMFETTKNLEIEAIKFLNKKFRVTYLFLLHGCGAEIQRIPSIRLLKRKMALGICVFLDWEHVWNKAHCNLHKQYTRNCSRV